MKTAIDVEIMGQRLSVTSDDGEVHLRRVVDYLNDRMRELTAGGSGGSGTDTAILAALNIASEYWKLREEQEEVSRALDRLSRRIVDQLGG